MRFHFKPILFLGMSFLIWNCRNDGHEGATEEWMPPTDSLVACISDIPEDVKPHVPQSTETTIQIELDKDRLNRTLEHMIDSSQYRKWDCESIYQEFYLAYSEAAKGEKLRLNQIRWTDPVVSFCMDKYKSRFDSLEIIFPEKK